MSDTREHPERACDTVREIIYDTWERYDKSDTPAVTDAGEIDPFTNEHDIEYWIWDGEALIPASPVESERFREREALRRLSYWQTYINGYAHAQPKRWHAIVTTAQAALGKWHARLSGRNI
ncbi:MAG TPA: hypothetical protein VF510_20450 [Ktedonobacterales bacterium]